MGTPDPIATGSIILFDGLCNLCSGSVQFVINRDRGGHFKFASLQSPLGASCLAHFNLRPDELYSIILIERGVCFQKSSAVLEIAGKLDGLWPVLVVFKIIPRVLRDWAYGVISRNRYAWFGKKDVCMIPTPELKSRFLQ